jgi:hypothetical protein
MFDVKPKSRREQPQRQSYAVQKEETVQEPSGETFTTREFVEKEYKD